MDNVWQLIGVGAVAGVFPIYLGIGLALLIAKGINRSLEGYLTGIATGVLVYLFFDLMHEAVEQTGATDPLSWVAFFRPSAAASSRSGTPRRLPSVSSSVQLCCGPASGWRVEPPIDHFRIGCHL